MTEAPISPLRRRMIEDMTIRKFAPRTQEGYIRAVKGFSAFLGASPDRASFEDLRRYQLHLVASDAGSPTINHTVTALRSRRLPRVTSGNAAWRRITRAGSPGELYCPRTGSDQRSIWGTGACPTSGSYHHPFPSRVFRDAD
jgi:hypothetical protein